jgi:hypothetical protein
MLKLAMAAAVATRSDPSSRNIRIVSPDAHWHRKAHRFRDKALLTQELVRLDLEL